MEDLTQLIKRPFYRWKSRMKAPSRFRWSGKIQILIWIIVVIVLLYNFFFVYIRPSEFGIKVVKIGFNRGVQTDIYSAGLNFIIPFGFQSITIPQEKQQKTIPFDSWQILS